MATTPNEPTRVQDIAPIPAGPFESVGVPGYLVTAGWLLSGEKDAKLRGTQRYVTFANILANTTIVAAGVRFFLNLVAKAGWKVEPADDSEQAHELAEVVEKMMHDMERPWHRVVRRAAMFRFFGFSLQEWTAKRGDDGAIGWKDIAARPQKTIERWDVTSQGEVLGVVQTNPQNGQPIYLPREKLVYLVDDAIDDSPEGLGLFRHLAKAAASLDVFELLEAWGFETDLRGIPIARAPLTEMAKLVKAGAITEAQANALRRPLEDFVSSHNRTPSLGILLDSSVYRATGDTQNPSSNPQYSVDLLKGDTGPHEFVAKTIERINREIARVLGVEQLLLGSDSKGSHALATDKTQSFGLIVDSTLNDMREAFRKDLLRPIWELNGWDPELMPRFKVDAVQFRDIEQITGALRDMAQAGAPIAPGDEVVDEVRDLLGLSHGPDIETQMDLAGQMADAGLGPDGKPLPPPPTPPGAGGNPPTEPAAGNPAED